MLLKLKAANDSQNNSSRAAKSGAPETAKRRSSEEAIHENFDALKRKRIVQRINPPENMKERKKVI
jgi:hypothetical protein